MNNTDIIYIFYFIINIIQQLKLQGWKDGKHQHRDGSYFSQRELEEKIFGP